MNPCYYCVLSSAQQLSNVSLRTYRHVNNIRSPWNYCRFSDALRPQKPHGNGLLGTGTKGVGRGGDNEWGNWWWFTKLNYSSRSSSRMTLWNTYIFNNNKPFKLTAPSRVQQCVTMVRLICELWPGPAAGRQAEKQANVGSIPLSFLFKHCGSSVRLQFKCLHILSSVRLHFLAE